MKKYPINVTIQISFIKPSTDTHISLRDGDEHKWANENIDTIYGDGTASPWWSGASIHIKEILNKIAEYKQLNDIDNYNLLKNNYLKYIKEGGAMDGVSAVTSKQFMRGNDEQAHCDIAKRLTSR